MATSLQREDLESISGTVHSMDDLPCSVMVVSQISLPVVAVRQVLVEVLEEFMRCARLMTLPVGLVPKANAATPFVGATAAMLRRRRGMMTISLQ